jgi:hypothetical protein
MDDKEKLEKVVKDAKELLYLLNDYKERIEINNKTVFFKNIDRLTIAKYIIPYLDIKDIINFRTTCKDVNAAISSTVGMVSYYRVINKKKETDLSKMFVKPIYQINDSDDIQAEIQSLKTVYIFLIKIRDFLTQKLFQSESILKLYKNDLEYLKSELKSQNEITEKLNEALSQTREELEDVKKYNINIKNKLDETSKKYEENV